MLLVYIVWGRAAAKARGMLGGAMSGLLLMVGRSPCELMYGRWQLESWLLKGKNCKIFSYQFIGLLPVPCMMTGFCHGMHERPSRPSK